MSEVMSEATEVSTATLLKKKSKTSAKSAVADDLITTTAASIENMDKDKALQTLKEVMEQNSFNEFRLGGLLALIQKQAWYPDGMSFKDALETKEMDFGFGYRKAAYLISNYNHLVEHQIPWGKVQGIGWTKLHRITPVLNAENVDYWVKMAETNNQRQLEALVKAELGKLNGDAVEDDKVTSTVQNMTFKVHTDQKETIRTALDKAKADLTTEYDTVALEGICTAFLGGTFEVSGGEGGVSMKDMMLKMSYMEVLEVFEQVFPDLMLTVEES
jgi:hypothetical protein